MNERLFVLMHGLPGVGKTTACRKLSELCADLFYADMGAHPEFRKRSMMEICAELYVRNDCRGSLITEGVFLTKQHRDGFIEYVSSTIGAQCGVTFDRRLIVYLRETDMAFMSRRRRNRTPEEYRTLLDSIETGSDVADYVVYDSMPGERDELTARVSGLLNAIGGLRTTAF